MPALKSDVLLQIEQSDSSFLSRSFSGVPASRASRIAIVSSASVQGCALVMELAGELEAVLLASSPQVVSTDVFSSDDPLQMQPAADPTSRRSATASSSMRATCRTSRRVKNGQWQ